MPISFLNFNISLFSLEDRWILSVLNRTVKNVNQCLQNYQFDQAALQAYDFFWKEFCAYYVELSKPVLFGKAGTPQERTNKQKLLVIVLCQALRLMHPMAPFITEELFHALKEQLQETELLPAADSYTQECVRALNAPACIVAPYPQVISENDIDPQINRAFDLMEQIVYTIRNIRGEMKLPPGMATNVYIIGSVNDPEWEIVKENCGMIGALVREQSETEEPAIEFGCTGVCHAIKIILPLPQDMLEQEKARLSKEKEKFTFHWKRSPFNSLIANLLAKHLHN